MSHSLKLTALLLILNPVFIPPYNPINHNRIASQRARNLKGGDVCKEPTIQADYVHRKHGMTESYKGHKSIGRELVQLGYKIHLFVREHLHPRACGATVYWLLCSPRNPLQLTRALSKWAPITERKKGVSIITIIYRPLSAFEWW